MHTQVFDAYIATAEPRNLKAQGLLKKIKLREITSTLLHAIKDLLALTTPQDDKRKDLVLDGVAQIFDRLAKRLPITWMPFVPLVRLILIKWLAPIVYDFVVSAEIDLEAPSKPSEPRVIYINPDTGKALETLQTINQALDQRLKEDE